MKPLLKTDILLVMIRYALLTTIMLTVPALSWAVAIPSGDMDVEIVPLLLVSADATGHANRLTLTFSASVDPTTVDETVFTIADVTIYSACVDPVSADTVTLLTSALDTRPIVNQRVHVSTSVVPAFFEVSPPAFVGRCSGASSTWSRP